MWIELKNIQDFKINFFKLNSKIDVLYNKYMFPFKKK